MSTYKTPGVYVEEISTLPPSVAQVATAVPAFIGFTEKGPSGKVVKISSMLEFRNTFGGVAPSEFSVSFTKDASSQTTSITSVSNTDTEATSIFYYCMRHYFDNGGGNCYVVSLGAFSALSTANAASYTNALDLIRKVDEPTLLVFPEALSLPQAAYYSVVNHALKQCAELKDRFTLMDVHTGDLTTPAAIESELKTGAIFRSASLISEYLKYGAAYTPYLHTSYPYGYLETGIKVNETIINEKGSTSLSIVADTSTITVNYNAAKPTAANKAPSVRITFGDNTVTKPEFNINGSNTLEIKVVAYAAEVTGANASPEQGSTLAEIQAEWAKFVSKDQFELVFTGDTSQKIKSAVSNTTLDFPTKLTDAILSTDGSEEESIRLVQSSQS